MAITLADRIKQYTTTTGAGDVSLTGTPAGFAAFSSVLSDGDITYYAIEENDKWEVGVGIYGSDNMVRDYVLASSNGGSHINLGGSGTVFVTYPADKSVHRDQESRVVVGPSGLVFDNGTTFKESKLTELTDVSTSGTIASTHVLALNNTNKSLLLGDLTGPSNSNNTLIGYGAGSGITSGHNNVAIGTDAGIANNAGTESVSIGALSGPSETVHSNPAHYVVSVGYKAGSRAKSSVTAIGHQAGMAAYETGFVAVGAGAGYGIGEGSVGVGKEAAHGMGSDYVVAVGHQAAKSAAGDSSVWIGDMAGVSATSSNYSVGIGYRAGKDSSATDSIYIGKNAGRSNSDDDYLYIGNGLPSSNRTLIKGDMQSKRLAVGAADVTLEDTFYIGINAPADKGLVVRAAVSQSDDLTQWQTSAGAVVAGMTPSGVLNTYGVVASGAGLRLSQATPAVTTDTLYNAGGSLYFNGSEIGGGASAEAIYASGEALSLNAASGQAVYASGQAIDNESDIVAVSGIANYASGQATNIATNTDDIATNGTNITANAMSISTNVINITNATATANYASGEALSLNAASGQVYTNVTNIATNASDIIATSGIAAYASGHVHDDIYVSEIATYASGEALSLTHASGLTVTNASDIVATSGIANYASGQAIANEADIVSTVAVANYASGEALSLNAASGQVYTNVTNIATNASDIIATSGIAAYASGHVHDDIYVSEIATYASGEALSLTHASGLTVTNASDIVATSGIANYASGQAIANEADIVSTVAVANYASGEAFSLNAASGQAVYASGNSLTNAGNIVATSGIANYASGQAQSLGYASGVAVYASGGAITNSASIDTIYSVLIPALTDISNNTSNISTNTSNISTNVTNIATNSARVTYASGLAISNESQVAYASGQAIANESDIVATSGIATYASGQALSLTHASGLTATNATNITAATNTANYASGQALSLTHASGLTATNAANITATTAVANYASGEALSLNAASGQAIYASGQAIENEGVLSGGVPTFSGILFVDNDINIGLGAGGNGAQGDYSVNVGEYAGYEATGLYNVNIGREAGRGADADRTVNIGNEAGEGVETNYAVSVGYLANKTTDGTVFGTAVGYGAGNACSNMGAGFAGSTAVGAQAGNSADDVKYSVLLGSQAGMGSKILNEVVGIGYQTLRDASGCRGTIAVGRYAGYSTWDADYCSFLGYSAGRDLVVGTSSHTDNIAIGQQSFYQASGDNNICVGKYAGRSLKGSNNIEIVTVGASTSFLATSDGVADKLHIQNTIAGDTSAHKIAIGAVLAADLSPDATLEIIPAAATDVSLIARGAVSQSADLTSWQTSAGSVVAAMTPSGILNTYGVVASGAGVVLANNTPAVTTNTLYNDGGTLSWNGSAVGGGGGGGTSAEATYASGQAIENEGDIVAVSGIANYASGQAIANEADIVSTVAVANYASGEALSLNAASGQVATNTTNIATNATDIVATSGIANYASGLAITNESQVAYASGQAIENEGLVTYASGNTANIAFGDDDDVGDILYHNGASFTRLAKGTDNYVLTMNGNVPNWEAAAAGGVSWDGSTANGVATFKNTNEATVESNLTFDGNTLTVATSSSSVSPTVVKAAASQTADLTSWETSAGGVVAAMTASGVLNTYGVVASGDVSITGDSELNLVGAYVNEAVPASNTPTASTSRTLTFDLSTGNYHNQSLPSNSSVGTVNKIIFANAKRGQRFIIRLTQHASSANTVSWGDVDANASNLEAIVRWAGNIEPTMSTTVSNTDVYGFLCTNDLGTKFDGFIIGQDLPA